MNVYVVSWEADDPIQRVDGSIKRQYCEVQIGESAKEVAERYLGRFDEVTIFPLEMKTTHPFTFHADMVEIEPS